VRGTRPWCPIDERLQREVDALVQAGADSARGLAARRRIDGAGADRAHRV